MAADTPRSTPWGVKFTAPSGWSVLSLDSAVILEPPEADSRIAIVTVQANDADAAAAAAWKVYKPEANRPVRVATDRPAREGWEHRGVRAQRRRGDGKMSQGRYLIIGGTTKAGTTSLHAYLNDHPQVCASSIKETRFFLDRDYPLEAKYRSDDGLEYYEEYFAHRGAAAVRVEATPDYLYSPGTAARLAAALPQAAIRDHGGCPTVRRLSVSRRVVMMTCCSGHGRPSPAALSPMSVI